MYRWVFTFTIIWISHTATAGRWHFHLITSLWSFGLSTGKSLNHFISYITRLQHWATVLFWCILADWTLVFQVKRKDDKRPVWEWEDEWAAQQSYWHLRLHNFVENAPWAPYFFISNRLLTTCFWFSEPHQVQLTTQVCTNLSHYHDHLEVL